MRPTESNIPLILALAALFAVGVAVWEAWG